MGRSAEYKERNNIFFSRNSNRLSFIDSAVSVDIELNMCELDDTFGIDYNSTDGF